MGRFSATLATMIVIAGLTGCGYNDLQGLDEDTKAAWSEVINQYQRRADLIPNLVATVKGYAAHEKDTLEGVVQARAQATGILILVSLLEHRVQVLADKGINDRVPPGTWDGLVNGIIDGIRTGRATDAICDAIARCGALLT